MVVRYQNSCKLKKLDQHLNWPCFFLFNAWMFSMSYLNNDQILTKIGKREDNCCTVRLISFKWRRKIQNIQKDLRDCVV